MLRSVVTVLTLMASGSGAIAIESPFNGRPVPDGPRTEAFTFLVGGHLYGAHGNSVYPAPSLLANLPRINASGAQFFMALGDVVRSAEVDHFDLLQRSFAERLQMPMLNAAGNHDVSPDRALYEKRVGPTFFSFSIGSALCVVLDTELHRGGKIDGDQMTFLKACFDQALNDANVQCVFVFSHKLVWNRIPGFEVVYEHANARYRDNGFAQDVLPQLERLAKHKTVTWMSGDIGTHWSKPLFYQQDARSGVTYAAVGLGDTAADALLEVTVRPDGRVEMSAWSLTAVAAPDLADCGPDDWARDFARKPPPESALMRLLRSRALWVGGAAGALLAGVAGLWIGRRAARRRELRHDSC